MNFFQRLFKREVTPTLQVKVAPFMWPNWTNDTPQWGIVDYQSYVNEGFNLNTLIYSAIMYKARAQIASPLRAYTGDSDDPELLTLTHPLARLLDRPNPHQSQVEFRQQSIVYLNISGDNFTLLDRPSPNRPPDALYNLRPDRVLIVPGKDKDNRGTIKGFVYVPEGKSAFVNAGTADRARMANEDRALFIDSADMMHTKLPNPGDPLEGMGYGLSPVSPLARSADVDNSITHFLQLFFQNGVMLPGVLSSDMPLDDATVARIKERWKEMYGGYDRWAEEIGVLERGTTYQRVGLAFNEMGFGEQDERNETRILSPFGVPAILVSSRIGLLRSTYSNYEEARKAFWQDTMVPENTLFEVDYQYFLSDGTAWPAFDYGEVPAFQDIRDAQQTQMAEAFKVGAVTRDEYRRALGLRGLGPPQGERFVISPMMVEVPLSAGAIEESDEQITSDSDARKVVSFPIKKKAPLQLNRKTGSQSS